MVKRIFLVSAVACMLGSNAAVAGDDVDWPFKSGNESSQHFSPLDEINDRNVDDLALAWSADIPSPDGIATTPIVIDGVVYVSAAYSVVYAVDAGSGELLWRYDPDVRAAFAKNAAMSWRARASRGIAVFNGRVYATTADCRLIALDATTGKPAWTRVTCDFEKGYGITDSPYVGGGKIFVGNSGSESGGKVRSFVSAYDPDDGRQLWRFYIVPSDDPDENTTPAMKMAAATWSGDALETFGGGGSNWNEMTYDAETGLLFFGTAGALPYVWKIRSPAGGDNLFLSSIIAVHADTGDYAWHYQTVPQDSWEYNATMNITLGELDIRGKTRQVLMVAPKNGFHYVLDRRSGELLAADKFAKVNWATHINLETGRPVYDPAAEYWNHEPGTRSQVWPNMWGAHSWQPMAWHPAERLSYIPVVDIPTIVSDYQPNGDFHDTLEIVTEVDGQAFSPGKLVAFDPVAGKPRWTVDHDLPFNGGILATAGNLVFQGDAHGRFRAFTADTGQELWSITTGSAISAAPSTYAIDGRQYIVLPVGSGGGMQWAFPEMHATAESRGPTRLMAFSLEGKARLPAVTVATRTVPELPPPSASAETIAAGASAFAGHCYGCHGKDAVGRPGGTVPDLRYSDATVHAAWAGIVIGGARQLGGMPRFEISAEEAEAIRQYVLSRSLELRKPPH